MPVIFLTDAFLFLMLIVVLIAILYIRRTPHLLGPWMIVCRDPIAMAVAIILFFYVLIGLMDSIHLRPLLENNSAQEIPAQKQYSAKVLSLLDLALEHLHASNEKTYSAPFATHSYSKETIDVGNGQRLQIYPQLYYGGRHLVDPERDKTKDILLKSLTGIIYGAMIWCLVSGLIILIVKLYSGASLQKILSQLRGGNSRIPWGVIHITLGAVLILLAVLLYLSHYYHVFGTDKTGQDVLYQTIKSIRTGMVIGVLSTLVMLPFAIFLGLIAGYFSSLLDDAIQYIYTTLSSIPGVLLIAATILMLQVYMSNHAVDFVSLEQRADMRLFFLCVVLGITNWAGLCRLLRGEALKLREMDYVLAARALGVNHLTIMLRHLLPNVMHIIMIVVVIDFSGLVMAEVVLSYINIGVDPSMHSWGNMINSARLEMAREPIVWWPLLAAFVFMFTLVLAANLFSDAVRDALNPRLQRNMSC